MSFLGGRRAIEPPRPRRRKYVCLSLSGRFTLPILNSWFASGHLRFARCWASREGLCGHGARGLTIGTKSAARSRRSLCCIPLSCYDNPCTSDLRGRICERLKARSKVCRPGLQLDQGISRLFVYDSSRIELEGLDQGGRVLVERSAMGRAIGPLLPKPARGAKTDHRQVIGGVVHALKTGCRWRDCPAGYGPSMTVYNRFRHWMMCGIWRRLFDALARADPGDGQPSTARRPRPTARRRAEKGGAGAGDWPFARPPQHEDPRHRRRAWTPHRHRSDAWPSRRRSRRGSLDHRSSGRRLLGCRRRLRQRWSASLLLQRGTVPVIPNNPTRKRHHRFDKTAYRRHNLIARMFCHLKDWDASPHAMTSSQPTSPPPP